MFKFTKEELVSNFVQLYKDLIKNLPHLAVHNFRCQNSDYSDQLVDSKNAYLCFNGYGLEDCYYLCDSRWNKNCVDLTYGNKCELCYDCLDCDECYNCDFMQDCERCVDCLYCYDCFGGKNCFGCVGLRNKEYHVFNRPYSKEEYVNQLAEARKMSDKNLRAAMEKQRLKTPQVAMRIRRSENCNGNYIFDSKNVGYGFNVHKIEDGIYMTDSQMLKDSADTDMTFKSELMYEAIEDTDNYNCNFVYWSANSKECEYIMYCFDCEHCFGCFDLKWKKFCILNEQYEEKEYFELVDAIKNGLEERGLYKNFLPEVA